MAAKITNFVERARVKHGDMYDYSKTHYRSARETVTITCREHGDFEQLAYKHLEGHRCPRCAGRKKLSFEEFLIRARAVHGDRYRYEENSFKTMLDPMRVICPDHGVFMPTPSNHTRLKTGCPRCSGQARGEAQRLDKAGFIERARAVHGITYDYSQVEYLTNGRSVKIVCLDHGVFEQTPAKHLSGQGCPSCAAYYRSASKLRTLDQFIADAREVHGGRYDYSRFEYTFARNPSVITCKKHGDFGQTPDAHLAGKGCPRCVNQISRWEMEVKAYLESLGATPRRCRKTLSGLEIDLYMDEQKVGIECNGVWFHSTRYSDDSARHLRKHLAADREGVRLIQVFEDEWMFRRSAVENLLAASVGKAERTYARDCTVCKTTVAAVTDFLEAHHIQGAPRGGSAYTLQKNGELVACMVFAGITSERGAADAGWELIRYASKGTVVGGASRLFRAFSTEVCPSRVISYSDRRLFSGGMYQVLGFKKVHDTRPNYTVLDGKRRRHKANYKKANLVRRFGLEAVAGKSEREVCEANNLYRVYDCGLTKWELLRT